MHTVEKILNQSSTNLSSNFVMLVAYNIFLSQITEEFINDRSVGIYQRNKSLTVTVTLNHAPSLLWPPYRIGQAIIFLPGGFFYLLSCFLSFFRRRISAIAEWMSTTLSHMMWP